MRAAWAIAAALAVLGACLWIWALLPPDGARELSVKPHVAAAGRLDAAAAAAHSAG